MAKMISAEVAQLIRENDRLERRNAELSASLEYIAMMADVELPEEEEPEDE